MARKPALIVSIRLITQAQPDNTYRTADDEKPFFLLMNPLGNLGGTLHQCIAIRVGLGNAVKLKHRGDPCE